MTHYKKTYLPIALIAFWGATLINFSCGGGSGDGTANAGTDFKALIGQATQLDGNSSTGSVKNIEWTITSAPSGSAATLSNSNTLTPSVAPDVAGSYVFKLSINKGKSTDTVTVTAKSVLAKISIGDNGAIRERTRFGQKEYAINLGEANAALSASQSQGAISGYLWEQLDGPGITTFSDTGVANITFTAPTMAEMLSTGNKYKWQVLPLGRNNTRVAVRLTVTGTAGDRDSTVIEVFMEDAGSVLHHSAGLPNVPLNAVTYLAGPSLKAQTSAASLAVDNWSWSMVSRPSGSSATFTDSGNTTSTAQFPKFTPDVAGLYRISYASTVGSVSGTLNINAGDYVGVGTVGDMSPANPQCGTCHNGGVESDKVTEWSETKHAKVFENNLSTYFAIGSEPYLWDFHTVGYNTDGNSSGFDNAVSSAGFSLSSDTLDFATFVATYPDVAKLSGVQCESCHGPGSGHSGNPTRIALSYSQTGTCAQCHLQEGQWANALHNSTGVVHGAGRYQSTWTSSVGCVRCHTGKGFADYVKGGHSNLQAITETGAFPGVTCAACHDPHNATNDSQLRLQGNVTMVVDGSVVNAGKAAVCYTCHDGLYSAGEDDCDSDDDGKADAVCASVEQTAAQYYRQVHYNPQAPMLEGKGAAYDFDNDSNPDFATTENSFHSQTNFTLAAATGDSSLPNTNNKCVTCHMAEGPSIEEDGYNQLGGHTFKVRTGHSPGHAFGEEDEPGTFIPAGDRDNLNACTSCHLDMTAINRESRADYDGDGTVEGVNDEYIGVLKALADKILAVDASTGTNGPNLNTATGTRVVSGSVLADAFGWAGSSSAPTGANTCASVANRQIVQSCNFLEATVALRKAVWNHNMMVRDGSMGTHNFAFAIQLMQKTYTALGGNSFKTDFPAATLR